MATLEDIVAATKLLSEDPASGMGGSGSKPNENQDRVSDVREDDGVSARDVVVGEGDMESGTVVESTFDEEKEKIGMKSLSVVPSSSLTVQVNGVDDSMCVDGSQDELVKNGVKNDICEDSLADNGEGRSTDYMDVDGDGEEGMDEKLNDIENVFCVGDFVWGKIRSHPWWPGQVYDPKDASEFALKRKQEGRLLVAFFGDGSCSWCLPSQLKPFVENFSVMSMDGSSKSFLNAVEKAVDEVGRLVELEMTCNCVPKEKKDGLARPVVENAGLEAGVIVPEVDASRLCIPKFEPEEVLKKVTQLAKSVSVGSALDLALLKSWLSAFYCHKSDYILPVYHEPLHIEGMEDKNKNVNEVANDFSVPIEVPILRPQDDDWLSSPAAGSVNSQGPSENKVSYKRKQKSVAELMGESKNIKPGSRKRGSPKEGADIEKSSSTQKRNKNNDGEVGSGGDSSTGKRGRKRKAEAMVSPKKTNEKDSNAETRASLGGADGVNGGRLLRKPKEIEVASGEEASAETKEEMEIVSSPRERKKSKYLSPPYTNPSWRMGGSTSSKPESEVDHDKSTEVARVEERKEEATKDDSASQPISKSVDNTSEEKLPNGKVDKVTVSDNKSSPTVKNDKKLSFPVIDVDFPVNELLSNIELAALDPLYLSKEGSLDMVDKFVSAHRSSTCLQGQDYKIYHKRKANRNRKSLPSQLGIELTQSKAKSPRRNTPKASETAKTSDTSNSKKTAETSVVKGTMETAEGTTSPCLILQFAAGFPLPSKKEIFRLFGKFGSLSKKETKTDSESHLIRIVYTKDSDAEEAFKSSLKERPFGSENVNYRLQLSSAGSKSRKSHPKVLSPLKRAPEKREGSHPRDDLVSDFNTIRQQLEITTAIVENYCSRFSSEDKCSLRVEMKHLMEEVETISEKVRVMAEKTSS